jgi:hypothetical protein
VRIIKVGVFDEYAKRFTVGGGEKSGQAYGELATPIVTLLNARRARALAVNYRYSFDRAYFSPRHPLFRGDDQYLVGKKPEFYSIDLNATEMFLPLGWQLSKLTMERMDEVAAYQSTQVISRIRGELMEGRTAR